MDLISSTFLFFVLFSLAVYYLLPFRFQNLWLLFVSLVFYLTWGISFTIFLLLVTTINFFLAKAIGNQSENRKIFLWIGLFLNISSLFFFRMTSSGYLVRLIEYITRQPANGSLSILNALLPIGFSFYILQAISYLIDIYQKQIQPSDNFIDFFLYMAYFPKMLSGPIERARSFLPQLSKPRRVDVTAISRSFLLLFIGLVRKVMIAEVLKAAIPEFLFTKPLEYAATDLAFGIAIYGFWLYNDFAGYTGIVRGISGFLGIELSPNFQQPFFARTFVEFWNRWHISLSFWLRDYIYFPLSRSLFRRISNQKNLISIYLPPLVTMLASGFWHNLGFYMLSWGALHGLYQATERFFSSRKPGLPANKKPAIIQILNILKINILLIPTWILFGSGGLQKAFRFSTALFTAEGKPTILPVVVIVPIAWIVISLLIDWFQYHSGDEFVFLRWNRYAQASALAALSFALFMNTLWSEIPVASFIYQGF
jgi:alginate O-acetyltransferase complex protein AlgI